MKKSIKKKIAKAKKELASFSKGSSCPICRREFRDESCPHSFTEVKAFLNDVVLRLKVQQEIYRILQDKDDDNNDKERAT